MRTCLLISCKSREIHTPNIFYGNSIRDIKRSTFITLKSTPISIKEGSLSGKKATVSKFKAKKLILKSMLIGLASTLHNLSRFIIMDNSQSINSQKEKMTLSTIQLKKEWTLRIFFKTALNLCQPVIESKWTAPAIKFRTQR